MEENEKLEPQEQEERYEPRPAYQVWAARIGLIFVLLFVAYQILSIATGGR